MQIICIKNSCLKLCLQRIIISYLELYNYLKDLKSCNCMLANDYYWIGIVTLNLITVYNLIIIKNTWLAL